MTTRKLIIHLAALAMLAGCSATAPDVVRRASTTTVTADPLRTWLDQYGTEASAFMVRFGEIASDGTLDPVAACYELKPLIRSMKDSPSWDSAPGHYISFVTYIDLGVDACTAGLFDQTKRDFDNGTAELHLFTAEITTVSG